MKRFIALSVLVLGIIFSSTSFGSTVPNDAETMIVIANTEEANTFDVVTVDNLTVDLHIDPGATTVITYLLDTIHKDDLELFENKPSIDRVELAPANNRRYINMTTPDKNTFIYWIRPREGILSTGNSMS